jgi:hypothetical protein
MPLDIPPQPADSWRSDMAAPSADHALARMGRELAVAHGGLGAVRLSTCFPTFKHAVELERCGGGRHQRPRQEIIVPTEIFFSRAWYGGYLAENWTASAFS